MFKKFFAKLTSNWYEVAGSKRSQEEVREFHERAKKMKEEGDKEAQESADKFKPRSEQEILRRIEEKEKAKRVQEEEME